MGVKFVGFAGLVIGLFGTTSVYPCSRSTPVSNVEMIGKADVIVRALAEEYAVPPKKSGYVGNFMPESTIRFKILEVIRGKISGDSLIIHGTLVDRDDFNDLAPPYTFVRPGGRGGNCHALAYRSGAQFLLVLKKNPDGELTPYWYALGPANEQLHSVEDPWLQWMRKEASRTSMHQPQ
jgi:hypothetical protein